VTAIVSGRIRIRPRAPSHIETPLQMSLTPTVDPVAAPLLASIPGRCSARPSATMSDVSRPLAEAGLSGSRGNTPERPLIGYEYLANE